MNKSQMAHEHIMKSMEKSRPFASTDDLIKWGWEYADKMQAEADKRNQDSRSLTKDEEGNCLHFHHDFGHKKCMDCGASLVEWQPDWSQAPERATAWKISNHGVPMWLQSHNNINQPYVWLSDAPSFNYQGNWENSLRKRP